MLPLFIQSGKSADDQLRAHTTFAPTATEMEFVSLHACQPYDAMSASWIFLANEFLTFTELSSHRCLSGKC